SLPDPSTCDIYSLSLHDALPCLLVLIRQAGTGGILPPRRTVGMEFTRFAHGRFPPCVRRFTIIGRGWGPAAPFGSHMRPRSRGRSEEHTSELQSRFELVCRLLLE